MSLFGINQVPKDVRENQKSPRELNSRQKSSYTLRDASDTAIWILTAGLERDRGHKKALILGAEATVRQPHTVL